MIAPVTSVGEDVCERSLADSSLAVEHDVEPRARHGVRDASDLTDAAPEQLGVTDRRKG